MYSKFIISVLCVFLLGFNRGVCGYVSEIPSSETPSSENRLNYLKDSLDKVFRLAPGEEKFPAALSIIKLLWNKDVNTALTYAGMGLKEAERTNNKYYIGAFSLSRGELERWRGNYKAAFDFLEQSAAYAHKHGFQDLYARSLLIQAKAHLDLSMMDAAYEKLVLARPFYEELGDERGLRELLTVQGCIYLNEDNFREALSYFLQAQEIDVRKKYSDFIMADAINLGVSYAGLKKEDSARIFYERALSLAQGVGDEVMTMTVYLNLAEIYTSQGLHKEALSVIQKALYGDSPNQKIKAQVLLMAGQTYVNSGQVEKGNDFFKQAFAVAQKYDFVEIAHTASEKISQYYLGRKQYREAAEWLNVNVLYADSSAQRQNIHNLIRLRYEFQYKEREQDLLYKQKMKWFVGLFVISLLVFFIVLLLIAFSRYRLKLKNAELSRLNMVNELEHKKKEIFTKVMYLRKKNEAIKEIAERLIEKKPVFKPDNQIVISEIVKDLLDYCKDDSWKEFELRFEEVYVDFFKNLSEHFPDLTANEKRLCAYLKLNMTTKDIAALLHMSVAGVESARYRLRKKLNINNMEVDLNLFLENL